MNIDKKEKILITGGGGFLGFYIVKLLLKNNYSVVSFSRSKYKYLEELNVPQICGDLTNRDDIKNALEDIDAVIHTASKVGMNGRYEDFYQSNYVGTKNLVDAMKFLKINKLVYTSTPSVVFGKNDLINADETTPYPRSYLTYYAETKMLAERYVLNNIDHSFMAVSLRPHLIFGPGDQNLVPRVLEAKKKNKLKIIGNGDNLVDVIYVENAALAHLFALNNLNSLISGNTYFIGQGPINLWTFTNTILEHYKLEKIEKKIPLWLAYYIGAIIEITLKIFQLHQVHPPMSRFIALQLGKSHYFNHEKALKDLGNFIEFSIPEGIQKLK
jgi:nucleoside-diphosphate-sugar epimerase